MKFATKFINDLFVISFITYIIYLGLEFLFEGLISNYFDLNILLIIVFLSGSLSVYLTLNYETNLI